MTKDDNFIKIGPYTLCINYVDKLENEGGDPLYGQWNAIDQEININANFSDRRRFAILWHEVVHAVDDAFAIMLSEQDVATLGTMIAQILIDNPNANWAEARESEAR